MDNYSALMKGVAKYICRTFDYGTYIQRSLENELNTVIPIPSRLIGVEVDIALSCDQKFIWGNNKAEYFKHKTKLEEKSEKAYTLIFGKFTEHMRSKLEARKD